MLPLLPEIVESTSFVFNDLSDVPKMGQLNVEKAIQSEDKELLLAFRSADGKNFPASLLKTGKNLKIVLLKLQIKSCFRSISK